MRKGEGASPILPLPKQKKITKRDIPHVDRDHMRGWDVAGPLFRAGATSVAIAEWPKYRGDQHMPLNHRLGLILQGKIQFRSGAHTFVAKRGELVFTPAGTTLQRTGLGPVAWLYIGLDDIPMWEPFKKMGAYVRKYESADLMYILTRRITGALRSQDTYSIHSARESAAILLTLIKREFRQSSNAWTSKRMDTFVKILDRIRPGLTWNGIERRSQPSCRCPSAT